MHTNSSSCHYKRMATFHFSLSKRNEDVLCAIISAINGRVDVSDIPHWKKFLMLYWKWWVSPFKSSSSNSWTLKWSRHRPRRPLHIKPWLRRLSWEWSLFYWSSEVAERMARRSCANASLDIFLLLSHSAPLHASSHTRSLASSYPPQRYRHWPPLYPLRLLPRQPSIHALLLLPQLP